MVGHPPRSLCVDDLGVDVRAVPLRDALLLDLEMPLPRGEQLVDSRSTERGHRVANCRSKSVGSVDQCSEDIEDDDLDVADLDHAFSYSCGVTSSAGDDLASSLITGQDGDVSFVFVSGSPALDLAGTVGSRRDEPIDVLAAPVDLERWVAACEELPDRVTADFATFESALSLREAIYQLALDRVLGRPFDTGSLRVVNDTAAGPVPTVKLSDAGLHLSGDLLAVLSQIARGGIAVLADPRACLKECGRTDCTRIYLDRSRGAGRTWCGMNECGNRVKAAAYRARRRVGTTAEGAGPRGHLRNNRRDV